ncbi:MAG TPA: LamG-like jellyroll fold domain-containing protein, partial [Verrucomicrobiae bacterium]|nr:LamG-like jellyroll fold domain-containing protein [Verrucomicrobiae bacterium]
ITPYGEQTNECKLGRALTVAGRATRLDGKAPHGSLVVELVRPDGADIPSEGGAVVAPGSTGASAATNAALNLPGEGGYATLPPNIFTGLTEATVEGWTRWRDEHAQAHVYQPALNFGNSTNSMYLGRLSDGSLVAGLGFSKTEGAEIRMPAWIDLNRWFHWALVTGPGGMELYLNGVLVGTNLETGSFAALSNDEENLLGSYPDWRSPSPQSTHGEMAECRVWRIRRTAQQIRNDLNRRLTGSEPGLVGLWNFDDPATPLRDRSPNGHHGQLVGLATITNVALPVVVFGRITDAHGEAMTNATVEIHQLGQSERRVTPNWSGEYAFTMAAAAQCDLFVTTGELSAYRLGFRPASESQRRLDWVLTDRPSEVGAGKLQSGDTNLASAVGGARTADLSRSGALSGRVVASVLTDDQGHFEFANVRPGPYQVRAQVPGGRARYQAGRILYAYPDASDAERSRLTRLEFPVSPFNKGRWKSFGVLDGLRFNAAGRTFFTPDGAVWNYAAGGHARFDGREFVPLSAKEGLTGSPASPLGVALDASGTFWMGTTEGLWR